MHHRLEQAPHDTSRPEASPLATRLASQLATFVSTPLDPALSDKVRVCLFDLIGCALESGDKPWSRQAMAMAVDLGQGGSARAGTIIGSSQRSSLADAAFVNAVMGHGLVREDMHSASISHLGVAVLPALLALSQLRPVSGRQYLVAAVAGYEVGARIGRALMDARIARLFRPTGITGPLGAAAAGACLLGLNEAQTTHALALATNTVAGFNQWGHTGGSEMYFHVGFAARNGVSAALLAQAGAFGSPSALDGEAGLFTSHGKREAADAVRLFEGEAEILGVYHKPVPACNFAQTACQVALAIAQVGCPVDQIEGITIRVPSAGANYPGCDFTGPYDHVLQAKMSIQYNVVAALMTGRVTEANFDLLQDPVLHRLLGKTRLEVDDDMSRVYPGQQGGAVDVRLAGGRRLDKRFADVVNATPHDVVERFRAAAQARLGQSAMERIEALINGLDTAEDAGQLGAALCA